MSSDEIVIDVRHLSKRYEIYATPRDRLKQMVLPRLHRAADTVKKAVGLAAGAAAPDHFREFWALKDVSFQVARGETLGVIGRNGSGKSTLLQILAGTLAQTAGEVSVSGRIAALLELGSGFNPEFSGRDNVFLNGRILGLSQAEIESRYEKIVEFAEIGEFIDEPVKTYSSGMFVRLAFAVQAHIDASIVIIDEALAVGDVFFRQKCYRRLEQLRESGAAILLVTHSMPDIEQFCRRALLLDHGAMRFIGPATVATKHYYLSNQQAEAPASAGAAEAPRIEVATLSSRELPYPRPARLPGTDALTQISNDQGRCTGVVVTDIQGNACNVFRQGDIALFQCEYEVDDDIGVPICGVVITNERGVIAFGKNSWQDDDAEPGRVGPGTTLICQQSVQLDLAPGEYTFEVGMVAVAPQIWGRRHEVSHDQFTQSHERRICHIAKAGNFSIGLADRDGVAILKHHGVANLPGSIVTARVERATAPTPSAATLDTTLPRSAR